MSSEKSWELQVKDNVWKRAVRFPSKDKTRVVETIEDLAKNPYGGDIEKMKGEENIWRRRVGAYRIFYEVIVSKRSVYIFKIERRGSKTY